LGHPKMSHDNELVLSQRPDDRHREVTGLLQSESIVPTCYRGKEDTREHFAVKPDAQKRLQEACQLDFGLKDPRPLAILPSIYNPDSDASPEVEVVRDVNGTLASFGAGDETVVMMLRPDRYVAAASAGSLVEMADRTRRMFHSHRSDSRIGSPVG
jgi:hypothetical protein